MESKKAWASKTVWGALMVVVVSVCNLAGVDLGDAGGWADSIVALLGAGLALYGRAKAVKKLSL